MKSTLMEEYVKPLISNETTEKKERKENPNQVCVVDLEKMLGEVLMQILLKGFV